MELTDKLLSRVIKTQPVSWRSFQFIQQDDFKELPNEAAKRLKTSIVENGFAQPFYVWEEPETGILFCLDGKHRSLILEELIREKVTVPDLLPATFIQCSSKKEAAEFVLIFSSIYAKVTQDGLFDFVRLYELDFQSLKMTVDLPEFDEVDFMGLFAGDSLQQNFLPQKLQERFLVPPFSVLDTRQGYWQERKKLWHNLFDSQETRENIELVAKSGQSPAIYELRNKMRISLGREPEWDEIIEQAKKKGLHVYEGASVFDPVLCEVLYTWFCPDDAKILDPFAGGSVRGIVAGIIGHNYIGIDLRKEQVCANHGQWEKIRPENASNVTWITGDSNQVLNEFTGDADVDFIFSCPPYADLEKYSDDPDDLSNMPYDKFLDTYRSIIYKAVSRLKENRFACFVVGDIRDKEGFYRNFLGDTVQAFLDAGMCYYNEIILVNVAGSLPIRIGRQFEGYRKVGKMHQNVLVFYKGDTKKIKEEFPKIKVLEDLESLEYQPNIAMSVTN